MSQEFPSFFVNSVAKKSRCKTDLALKNSDPRTDPAIDLSYFNNARLVKVLVEGLHVNSFLISIIIILLDCLTI
jgi:hypothetical protein